MNRIFLALLFWLASQSVTAETMTCNRRTSNYNCLVCNCYHESRGESREGKIAVAKTVLSRTVSDLYSKDTACGIIYEENQFSWTEDKYSDKINAQEPADINALKECREISDLAIKEGPNGLLFFFNPRNLSAKWARKWLKGKTNCGRIGEHVFFVPRGKTCPTKLGANGASSSGPANKPSNRGFAR